MDELFNNAPEIIRAAASSPLALAALVILTLGVLAFVHFKGSSELARVAVFTLTGIALLIILAVAAVSVAIREEITSARQELTRLPAPAPAELPADKLASALLALQRSTGESTLASTCVTPFMTCAFAIAHIRKGEVCNCTMADGLLAWEGVAN